MKFTALILLLLTAPLVSSGQSIQISINQVRAILKDHAELVMRREVAKTDSVAYQDLLLAYTYKDSAFRASQFANQESDRVAQSYAEMYHESDKSLSGAKKEIRRQKRIKLITMIGAGVILLLSI